MDATIDMVPDDLLSKISRLVRVRVMHRSGSQASSSRFHTAWQKAVKALRITNGTLTESDLLIISKYANLEKLTLVTGPLPSWAVIASLAPALPRLSSLTLYGRNCFHVLHTLSGTNLGSRLTELSLNSARDAVTSDDLYGLFKLGKLESLKLHAKSVELPSVRRPHDALSSLRSLHLDTPAPIEPAVLDVIPGSITSITSLNIEYHMDQRGEDASGQRLAASISRLVNLQHLTTTYSTGDADMQRRTFKKLEQLQSLHLMNGELEGEFAVLQELPALVELHAPRHDIRDPFSHPSLERLTACSIGITEQWKGQTAAHCKLRQLTTLSGPLEAELRNLPTIPNLSSLSMEVLGGIDERHRNVSDVIIRHWQTLQHVGLSTAAPYQEAMPQRLPECRSLSLTGNAVSDATLQILRMCSMPLLEVLTLVYNGGGDDLVASLEMDLDWLRHQQHLRKFRLFTRSRVQVAQLDAAFELMLPGVDVCVLYDADGVDYATDDE